MITTEQRLTRVAQRTVKVEDIKTRPYDFQYREKDFENHHVEEIAEAIRRRGRVDPMDLWKDPQDGELVVLDGHHRVEAYRRAGKDKVPAVIYEGTEEAARLHALRENAKARLPMTATEKINAAWRLVCQVREVDRNGKRSEEYVYSKKELVEHTGAADGTIGNMRRVRKRLIEAEELPPDTWYEALAALQGSEERDELTDEDREAIIEERTRRLDDKVGKDIGHMAELQIEAVIRMLEKRLGEKIHMLVNWWREDTDEYFASQPF